MKEINKKIIVLFLVFTFIFSPVLSMKAQAQGWPVYDNANFIDNLTKTIKEYGLDTAAWAIVNLIIERMSASTVNWINSGFKGSPAFITNPEAYYKDMGDKIAGQFIYSSPNLNFLCGPLRAKIRLALSNNYTQYDRQNWQCSVTGIANNVDAFMNNFENGGWEGFFELSQGPHNPIGAYLQVESEMMQQIANQKDLKEKDLLQGKGFMSFKKCTRWRQLDQGEVSELNAIFGEDFKDESGAPQGGFDNTIECIKEETQTPGSVIADQLNTQLGVGQEKLAVADEINEIVSALLNKLVSSVIGGIGSGLRGLSKPDSANNNQIFTTQLSDRKPGSQITGYFCLDNETDPTDKFYDTDPNVCKYPDTPNTDILDQPLPNPNFCKENPSASECQMPVMKVQIVPGATICDPAVDPSCTPAP